MKAMLVDDEPLALEHLAGELERIGGVEIAGKFRNPKLALEHADKSRPEAVFLDIEMPEMSGIELAERILARHPDTMIVFVTVYDEYAVKAFELNAIDYILKPLHAERLARTVARLSERAKLRTQSSPSGGSLLIRTLGSLQFEIAGKEPLSLRWKTYKAQELFAYLLQHRGKPVRKHVLLEQLWPDTDWKKGMMQLYTAIYQMRKLLHDEQIDVRIVNVEDGYMLDINGNRVDAEEWEKQMQGAPVPDPDNLEFHVRLSCLYQGDYLAAYPYLWAETERRRLRAMWLRHAKQIGSGYLERGMATEAAAHYLRVQSVLPSEESVYFELMLIYDRLSDRSSVEKQYELLKHMLRQEMGLEPHASIRKWFDDWKNGASPLL
ncbi:hypothetical protein SD70_16610 [Gordoniibacillus kamchatkensis]|uniref:Response regulator n=1 Tax=Gordoniibacillus kamchatkensis TaxID=1590651 RepID=A0ABR5AGP5_9BACL|nr:response regulator [Paenibacillus sp. VKM B-2647]KIL39998.1 hypothetical protein SD70_16610 [Paenibacillus sp. VKM B-2647]